MEQNSHTKKLVTWSALAAIFAGVIHFWIVPEHWTHAPAHSLFFLLVGMLQILWGMAVWRRPSIWLYYIGVLMAGWLIVLYLITRWLPAPFGHGPEAVEAIDIACKLCEVIGMVTMAIVIRQGMTLNTSHRIAWRALIAIALFSIIAGFATYGTARAAEPIFPLLSVPVQEHHHDVSTPGEELHHEEAAPTNQHHH